MRIDELIKTDGYAASLDKLVKALCDDYLRRDKIITDGLASRRTEMEYRYINYRMEEAASSIVGSRYFLDYIREIGASVGYAKSNVPACSESTYKKNKQLVKLTIARGLHLLD
jgi:hypothetical protein